MVMPSSSSASNQVQALQQAGMAEEQEVVEPKPQKADAFDPRTFNTSTDKVF